MEKGKEKQTQSLVMRYCQNCEPLEQLYYYYDFIWWRKRYTLEPTYERSSIKLPAFDVRSAIILFMLTHTEHISFPSVFNPKLKTFEGHVIESTFFQVVEYQFVKKRGFTSHQYKETKTYNRHDFLPLFGRRFITE